MFFGDTTFVRERIIIRNATIHKIEHTLWVEICNFFDDVENLLRLNSNFE
jgi:hypothetical protein